MRLEGRRCPICIVTYNKASGIVKRVSIGDIVIKSTANKTVVFRQFCPHREESIIGINNKNRLIHEIEIPVKLGEDGSIAGIKRKSGRRIFKISIIKAVPIEQSAR